MNQRTRLRRQRRHRYTMAGLLIGLSVSLAFWLTIPSTPNGPLASHYATSYQTASYGVKGEVVVASQAPARPAPDPISPAAPPRPSSVPEPTSLLLMAPALLLLHRRRA